MNIQFPKIQLDKKQFVKRSADWLEKISVASIVVGLFQKEVSLFWGFAIGIVAIMGSHYLDNMWRKL